jgi:hypothetical protein
MGSLQLECAEAGGVDHLPRFPRNSRRGLPYILRLMIYLRLIDSECGEGQRPDVLVLRELTVSGGALLDFHGDPVSLRALTWRVMQAPGSPCPPAWSPAYRISRGDCRVFPMIGIFTYTPYPRLGQTRAKMVRNHTKPRRIP